MVIFWSRNNDTITCHNFFIKRLYNCTVCLVIGLIKHRNICNIEDFNGCSGLKMLLYELKQLAIIRFFAFVPTIAMIFIVIGPLDSCQENFFVFFFNVLFDNSSVVISVNKINSLKISSSSATLSASMRLPLLSNALCDFPKRNSLLRHESRTKLR